MGTTLLVLDSCACRYAARLGRPFKSLHANLTLPAELFAQRIGRHILNAFLEILNIFIHLTSVLFALVHVHGLDVILGLSGVRLELSRGLFYGRLCAGLSPLATWGYPLRPRGRMKNRGHTDTDRSGDHNRNDE